MKSITQVFENLLKPYIDSHDRAAEAIIAPVETDATSASDDYAVGEQLILNDVLYDVIAAITTGDALVVNTNIKAADNVSSDIEALTKELEDEAATRSAQGAKNILPFDLDAIKALNTNGTWAGNVYTYRGVDFTVNSDGTVSATGTATGGNASIKLFAASSNYEMLGKEVILNGCPSNGSASTYRIQAYRMASADGSTGTYFDDGAGTDAFTVLNNASGTVGSFAIAVYENATVTNLLFKPMVRLASDPDATYQQYAKTNRELTAENQTLTQQANAVVNVYASKNLLPQTGKASSYHGVDFTVNSDGTVNFSGTITDGSTTFNFAVNEPVPSTWKGNTITFGAFKDTITDANAGLYVYNSSNTLIAEINTNGNTLKEKSGAIPSNADHYIVQIVLSNNRAVSGTLYPMVRDARIVDSTYEPYAKTNQELTEENQSLTNKVDNIKIVEITATSDGVKTYSDLLKELVNNAKAYVSGTDLKLAPYALAIPAVSFMPIAANKQISKSSSSETLVGNGMAWGGGTFMLYYVEFEANAAIFYNCSLGTTPSIAFNNKASDIPATGFKLVLSCIQTN